METVSQLMRRLEKVTPRLSREFRTESELRLWLKSDEDLALGPALDPASDVPRAVMSIVEANIPLWKDVDTKDAERGHRPRRRADGRELSGHVVWREGLGDFLLTLYSSSRSGLD